MITFHIIKDNKEFDTTTSLRKAKNRARVAGARAIVALQLTWTSEGYKVDLKNCYVWGSSIGVYVTYTYRDLLELHSRHIDLLPSKFMDLLEKQSLDV